MSTRDLIAMWEDALAQGLQEALSADEGWRELGDEVLEQTASGFSLRSRLHAGDQKGSTDQLSYCVGDWCYNCVYSL